MLGLVSVWIWRWQFDTKEVTDIRLNTNGSNLGLIGQGFAGQAEAYLLPIVQTNYLPSRNFNIDELAMAAKAAGLFDIQSEKFLYSKNINEKLPVASITKLMSAVVIMENLNLNETINITAEDINVDGKGSDLYKGETLKGSDLFKIMLIKSSNDAAVAFTGNATRLGVNIVAKMNERARSLGMINTKFTDAAGLNDVDSFSTVNDLIKLVKYIHKYPIIWETLITRSIEVSSTDGRFRHQLLNTNKLLADMPNIIGGKTGYTDGALETMILEIGINGGEDQLISVILGSYDRFGETRKLIDWGLIAYRWQ